MSRTAVIHEMIKEGLLSQDDGAAMIADPALTIETGTNPVPAPHAASHAEGAADVITYKALGGAVAAQGTLTLDTEPINGDTYTIDSKVYTFETSLTNFDGNVAIGGSLAQAKLNLVAALDLSGVAGTDYATAMTAHASVDIAAFIVDDVILTAKLVGPAGDLIDTTETFDAGTNLFDAATLGDTRAGTGSAVASVGTSDAPSTTATDADDVTNTDADGTYDVGEQNLINEIKDDYNAARTLINELKADYNNSVTLVNELKAQLNALLVELRSLDVLAD